MLTLQRASAGSGKTYTLARTFIRHLLTEQQDGKTTLRHEETLPDAVSHILAVTFTNKATNEMKQRIIDKLFALTRLDLPEDKVDYLRDFMSEFGISRERIASLCSQALKYLLLDYSNFNVSTIDSFFQNVLRTFTYEAELPDNYKLEIDTKYIAGVGVDTMVHDLMTDNMDKESQYWLNTMVRAALSQEMDYNIVNQREGSFTTKTLYGILKSSAEKIDNEDFKKYFPKLENFLSEGRKLSEAYKRIDSVYMPAINKAFNELKDKAVNMLRLYSKYAPKGVKDIGRKGATASLRKITFRYADPLGDYSWEELTGKKNSVNTAGKKSVTKGELEELDATYNEVSEAFRSWRRSMQQPGWEVWKPIRKLLPNIALMYQFRENIRGFLDLNSTMVLADTNTILSGIIEDGEVPFIYERLSTHIHHFLIDEFQDTSKMQWNNFRPLLKESMAHGYDNLIIGDAKQSIYRFRNADPSIITEKVPSTFSPSDIIIRGENVAQNSNWRSDLRIVQFNNYLFRRFHNEYQHLLGNLYAGVVQQPRQSAKRGYVEWIPYGSKANNLGLLPTEEIESDNEENGTSETKTSSIKFDVIGPMISEMLSRGYRQKDIAILCNRNTTGENIIACLMEYNKTLGEDADHLRFVSEQSLRLDSNAAVRVVISALRSLADGIYFATEDDKITEKGEEKVDWRDISTQFILYSNAHPDIPLGDRVSNFLNNARHDDTLSDMVSRMQATTLPALVEAIIDMFLHGSVAGGGKEEDTSFLAALQDAVIDYSNIYVSDIASFLEWWDKKGCSISISSPEDTDAINIMTIHKSKGLEFECVILPDIDISLEPSGNHPTWSWAKIPEDYEYASFLPTHLPVEVNAGLAGYEDVDNPGEFHPGPYAKLWENERTMVLADNLNKAYVAFTRAVSELYILTSNYNGKVKGEKVLIKDKDHILNKLAKYMKGDLEGIHEAIGSDPENFFLQTAEVYEPSEFEGIYYGEKPSAEDVRKRVEKLVAKEARDVVTSEVKGYYINADQSVLKFVEEDEMIGKEGDDDTADPRSEGTLIHNILEHTRRYDDLPGAVARMRMRGLLTSAEADEMQAMLSRALEATRETHWFDGTLRVVNERELGAPDYHTYRVDRLLITPEGKGIIVDYKTGTSEHNSGHHRQVRRYMELMMQTGQFSEIEGWLWYVKEGKIEKVKEREVRSGK